VTYIPNSIEARDVASLVHMQTNLRKHQQEGPLVIARGDGCRVYDNSGHEYIESIAGLWCASLGFASERLAKVAYEQMRLGAAWAPRDAYRRVATITDARFFSKVSLRSWQKP
jgi:4-aminobutyrate aminotransferase-like enzyme